MDAKRLLPVFVACTNRTKLAIISTLSLLLLFSFIPKEDSPIDKLVAALQHWTDKNPQEKVYLHLDKPYYALGDTVWFKGYVTVGSKHQLSALSGSLHVDLLTAQDSIVRSLKLPITSGMVMGDLTLGDDLREGSYRIRAYTQWMRNAGEEYFYDHTFTVGDLGNSNIISDVNYQYKTDNNKPVLTALVHYTDDQGRPLADRNVRYEIIINKRTLWARSVRTDAQGSNLLNIPNNDNVDLSGAYILSTITGSDKQIVVRYLPIKAGLSQSDVQFFPESGNLVNGVSSRVAFKAIGIDGLGTPIKGKVVDDANNEVAELETLHAGMGSFLLRPDPGRIYTANITFADGSTKNIVLPKAINDGYVLSVFQPNKDSILVRINAPANLAATNPTVNFIAQASGETIFASPVKIARASTLIWLDKKRFPGGISQFTLFDNNGEPLNERVAFIRSNDVMELSLKTAKTSYQSKEKAVIDLLSKDSKGKGVAGNFSVSIIDESKIPVDESMESTIFSNILLTSDLKGYVEKPNYYFTNLTEEVDRALDNLMLTQGYRRFTWKEIVSGTNPSVIDGKPKFEAEGLGVKISGTVQTLVGHKVLPGAKVNMVSFKANVMKTTTTDSAGRFKFDGIFMTDSIKFALQARTAQGSDKVKIILDTIPKQKVNKNPNTGDVSTNVNATLKAYIDNGKKLDDIYEKFGQLDRVHRLKEVRIRANRIKEESNITPQGMFKIPEQSADKVITFPEGESCLTLAMCLQARIQGVRVETSLGYTTLADNRGSIGLILDGRKITTRDEVSEILDGSVLPEDVAKILVVRTGQAMINYLGGAAIMIITKLGSSRHQYNPSVANVSPKGFNKAREFYSPKYDRPGNAASLPDLRSTIYWNPYLKTDAEGKASFNFFNADGPGNYRVVVEGINADGELGRAVYHYTVDEGQVAKQTPASTDKSLALITDPLNDLNKRLPQEKVYLHLDKPYYNIGDTLWFKSYLTDVKLAPSKLSGILYVELIDDSTVVARRVSVHIKDGVGWGQIALPRTIFHEGGYTLRAYTNWMQNFDNNRFFTQRFYLGVPAQGAWLVSSSATVGHVGDKDQLQVELKLNRVDKLNSPVALRKVQVRILESQQKLYDKEHYIYKEVIQTGLDGSLKLSQALKEKINGISLRAEVRGLEEEDADKVMQIPLNISRDQNIDLQFLPESGNLVAGLKSVVGFKALGEDGKGTSVMGVIYDAKGAEVVSFTTTHNGMGAFEFTPKAGEIYSARLERPIAKSFPLPAVLPAGSVMHVTNAEQADALKILICGAGQLNTDSACYLVGTVSGVVYYSQKVDIGQPEFAVAKNLFPSGIVRFTLFYGNRPLNERRVFIDNHDQLSISVTPDKTSYKKRDSVSMEINVKDKSGNPVQGNFSLAVTDDTQVRPDSLGNYSITASLLVNAEIKGNVESPGYYINRKDKQAWAALDNLMLTQGWTAYDWKDVFLPTKPIKFEAEKEFKITGRVSNLTNKPIPDASVIISSQKPQFITSVNVDAQGIYVFNRLPTIDSGSFFLQAKNAKGTRLTFGEITVNGFKPPDIPQTLRDMVSPWYVNTDSTQVNFVKRKAEAADEANLKLTGHILKTVNIKAKKIIKDSFNPFGPGDADQAFDEKDIKQAAVINLYELLKQKVPGFKIVKEGKFNGEKPSIRIDDMEALIQIDGRELPIHIDDPFSLEELIDEVSQFKIATFKGLEILRSTRSMNRLKNMHLPEMPWIIITTYNGDGWFKDRTPGTATYRPVLSVQPLQFYSPGYKVPPALIQPDYRATIYWDPNITTDRNGKAKVSFYTSDIAGKYTVKVAGVDQAGGIGDGSFNILTASKP